MTRLAVVLMLALAAFVSGCGGADVAYTEVESAPEGLPIPDGEITVPTSAATGGSRNNGNVTTGKATPTAEAVAPADGGAVAAPTAAPTTAPVAPVDPAVVPEDTTDDDTGAAAPPTAEEPVAPSGGSGGAAAPPTDQFCADNPGACNN